MEATGVYGEALCYDLISRGYRVAVESPLKVKRSFAQSAHKNDTVDARQIAEYGHRFYDELPWWTPPSEVLEEVRMLLSAREQFVTQRIANINALKTMRFSVDKRKSKTDTAAAATASSTPTPAAGTTKK